MSNGISNNGISNNATIITVAVIALAAVILAPLVHSAYMEHRAKKAVEEIFENLDESYDAVWGAEAQEEIRRAQEKAQRMLFGDQ